MGCLRRPVGSLFLVHIVLLLCAFLFVPFNRRGVSSAASPYNHGLDMDLPGPDQTDYPTDDQIIAKLLGVERDDAVFYTDVGSPWSLCNFSPSPREKSGS